MLTPGGRTALLAGVAFLAVLAAVGYALEAMAR